MIETTEKEKQIIAAIKDIKNTVYKKETDYELWRDTHLVLQRIPKKYKEFIWDYYVLDLTHKDIAELYEWTYRKSLFYNQEWQRYVKVACKEMFT